MQWSKDIPPLQMSFEFLTGIDPPSAEEDWLLHTVSRLAHSAADTRAAVC